MSFNIGCVSMATSIACYYTQVNCNSCIYTILPLVTDGPITAPMDESSPINLEKLSGDMAAHVSGGVSERAFSMAVTGGRNPDFYRHWRTGRQAKRLSADLLIQICHVLGRSVYDYVDHAPAPSLPNEAVLTQTMAVLLSSVGVDPYEDERARKIARLLPNALQDVQRLIENLGQEDDASDATPAHNLGAVAPQL